MALARPASLHAQSAAIPLALHLPADAAERLAPELWDFMDENRDISLRLLLEGPAQLSLRPLSSPPPDAAIAQAGVPFQRQVLMLFWNKDAFTWAGLDPEVPPTVWQEQIALAVHATRRQPERLRCWGLQIPAEMAAFQALAAQNGAALADADGVAAFDTPTCIEALQYWVDFGPKWQARPQGAPGTAATLRAFIGGHAAMAWLPSSSLAAVATHAAFVFGVAPLPAHQAAASVMEGEDFYLTADATPAQTAAAQRLLGWLMTPERQAARCIADGMLPPDPAAWDTIAMQQYMADFPAIGVMRTAMADAVPIFVPHTQAALDAALTAALEGSATPEAALAAAQAHATATK